MENKINPFKQFADWFIKKTDENRSTVILLAIIVFLSWRYYEADADRFAYIQKLEERISGCEDLQLKNIELERKLNSLSAEIIIFKASTDYFPFPYWVKNSDGKMLYLNSAYEKKYLRPYGWNASDYINRYDWQIWGYEIANEFKKNDSLVISNGRAMTFIEKVHSGHVIKVTKYPFKVGGQTFGVAGVEYVDFK